MALHLKPFQLLEINIISAQDLEPVSKKMRTYASAWVHHNRKLSSCVDSDGRNNPTWNDKFVFRVDEEFLRQDTSAVMIEIYAVHWLRDILVGTVRVLVGNLIPPPALPGQNNNNHHIGMRFVALQIRRPSGRPQGILNIGVALLDNSLRSMPLYTQLGTSAVGYRHLMDDQPSLQILQKSEDEKNKNQQNKPAILRRSRSERSGLMAFENHSPCSSMVGWKTQGADKGSSILSITESVDPFSRGFGKRGKASSVISGEKPKRGRKASSVVSDSIFSKESTSFHNTRDPGSKIKFAAENKPNNENNAVEENADGTKKVKTIVKTFNELNKEQPKPLTHIVKNISKYNGFDFKGKGGSMYSDSEVGPSPSEVAAYMAAERRYPIDDNQSSVLDGWSLDESVEGLRSKLERWRTEVPPLYDNRAGYSTSSYRSQSTNYNHKARRHSDGGSGLFSCFGNFCGIQCQCVCGQPPKKSKSRNTRFHSP